MAEEGVTDGGAVGVLDIPKGGVVSGEGVTSVGAEGEGRDVEKTGLEEVGRSDGAEVVGWDLEGENRGEDGVSCEELLVGGVL